MKKIIPLSLMCLLLIGIGQARAQTADQPWGFRAAFGVNHYKGDLGNTMLEFNSSDMFWGIGLAYYISPHLGLALNANDFTLQKANGPNDRTFKKRDTHFKTSDFNLGLMLRVKPFVTRLNPYIAFGLGGNFMHNLDNQQNQDSHFVFSIPFGIGVNYEITPHFSLNAQMIYNRTFTDDIIDSYPLAAGKAVDGQANKNLDHTGHDDFMLSTIGIVFNFGGGKNHEMSMQEKLLRQSMKNLKAAQNASDMSANNLQQAQQLNAETLAALDSLRKARNMSEQQLDQLKSDLSHIVSNIQFGFDKSDIIDPSKKQLNSLADILNDFPDLSVTIGAHADKRGSQSYNQKLSQRRAQSVKEYLTSHGVNSSRITTHAYGKDKPLMSGNTPTAYAQNRAVQLTLHYNGNMNNNSMSDNNSY
jgi:outer membrane protein OmpA-like peptidoglycan-associated protein